MNKDKKAVSWESAVLLSDITKRVTAQSCRIESFGNGKYLVYRIMDAYTQRECLV